MDKLKISPIGIAFLVIGLIIIGLLEQILYLTSRGKVLIMAPLDHLGGETVPGTFTVSDEVIDNEAIASDPQPTVERGPGGKFRSKKPQTSE